MDADAQRLPSGEIEVTVNGVSKEAPDWFWQAVRSNMRLDLLIRLATNSKEAKDIGKQ